ncbi:putative ribonuclease H-like domain-containing protein [Tanacetum coccineum]
MWLIRIKQYFQVQDYALWEVIENGNSWVRVPVTSQEGGTSIKITVPATIEEKICNEATKKTQKALLKQQYENIKASSTDSLDSIFNRFQKLISRLAILGVVITSKELNSIFLRSLPPEWNTHVVVWMNKPKIETMSIDNLYNNFKIVEQEVKKSVGTSSNPQNLAFVTALGPSSTNSSNTVNLDVGTSSTNVITTSTEFSTTSLSDAIVYAFLFAQPKGSQIVHEDLVQLHDDDLEEMDLKWNLALLSMRVRKFYQRTGRKITIDGSDTTGYDKSKVECFNCHKMGHFARECRAPRNKDNKNWNQGSSTKTVKIKDTSEKAMCAIDGVGFDWSDMVEEQVQTHMALMSFSDSEVYTKKSCSKTCLKNHESLKKQCDDVIVKLSDSEFKTSTYKRGLATIEDQLVRYKKNEVLFCEEIVVLKREIGCKEYELGVLRIELEKIKDTVIESTKDCSKESDNSKENTDDSVEIEQVSEDTSSSSDDTCSHVDSPLKPDREIVIDWHKTGVHTNKKEQFVKPNINEKSVKRIVRYAEMYKSQSPRGN